MKTEILSKLLTSIENGTLPITLKDRDFIEFFLDGKRCHINTILMRITIGDCSIECEDVVVCERISEFHRKESKRLENNSLKELDSALSDLHNEYLSPNWKEGSPIHNWRNHVGEETKKLWDTFTPSQKEAIYKDAVWQADCEEWE